MSVKQFCFPVNVYYIYLVYSCECYCVCALNRCISSYAYLTDRAKGAGGNNMRDRATIKRLNMYRQKQRW